MADVDYNRFWSLAFDDMGDFVFLLDADFNLIRASESFINFIGKSEKDLLGKKCYSLVHDSTDPPPECPHMKVLKTKISEREEFYDKNLKKWLDVSVTPIFDDKNNCIGSIHIAADITARKKAEEQRESISDTLLEKLNEIQEKDQRLQDVHEKLKEDEEKFRRLIGSMMDGLAYCKMLYDDRGRSVDFIYLEVNRAFERLTGLKNVVGKKVSEVIPGSNETHPELLEAYSRVASTGKPEEFEINFKPLAQWLALKVYSTQKGYFTVVFDNITARKRTEVYREMGTEVIKTLNEPGDIKVSIERVIEVLKARTGFDAVGIRLQDGDDFPYLAQKGFPRDFLMRENSLTARGVDGGLCRDKAGCVSLECTCGLIISGKTDPANPLFTKGGSCWMNDSFPLLDLPSDKDPRLHPRNQCIHQGYASVALVPIRTRDKIVGLIQFNDLRKGRFTIEAIELMEGMASHIGAALMRKRAEEDLKESKALIDTVVENTPLMIFLKEAKDLRFVLFNRAGEELLGYDRKSLLGKNDLDFFPPEQAASFMTKDRAVLDGKGGFLDIPEEPILTAKKGQRWLHTRKVCIRGADGTTKFLLGISEDITERKQAEDALLASQRLLEGIINTAPVRVFWKDTNSVYMGCNIAFARDAGFAAPKDIIGKDDYQMGWRDQADLYRDADRRVIESGRSKLLIEEPQTTPEGNTITLLTSKTPLRNSKEEIIGLLGAYMDITEIKRAESELAAAKDYTDNIIKSMIDALIVVGPDAKIKTVNHATLEMLRYKEDELIGKPVGMIIADDDDDDDDDDLFRGTRFKKLLKAGFISNYEMNWKNKAGKIIPVNFSGSTMRDHDGKLLGIVAVAHDVTERKQMVEELKDSSERYKLLFESNMDGIVLTDLVTKGFSYVNPSMCKMFGYGVNEFIKLGVEDIHPKESMDLINKQFNLLISGALSISADIPCLKKNGKVFYVNISARIIKINNKQYAIGFFRDITERRLAEEEIKKGRKQYVDLVDSLTDWIWEVDVKGRFTYVSPRVKDILGYEPKKIIGKTPFDLMPSKEARRVGAIFKQLSAEQKPIQALENIYRHKDGHQVTLETTGSPFKDIEGFYNGYRGACRDVTERKKAAKLLEFYKEYAENIVGNLPLSLIVVNRDLRINFANQHFLSKMRMTKEDVREKELAKVMGPAIVENSGLDEQIMRVIKRGEPRIEDRFIIKGKSYDYMIVPIKEQTGRRMNALLVMEDVTKNVMMEEQLIHSEKLSAVGTFTASVAHEINNPLSIVMGNIQYLLSNLHHMDLTKEKEIDEIVETLKTANAETRRCSEIVTNLLHFSHKGGAGKTNLSVNGVVTATMRLLAHQLELSKVKTFIQLADGLPQVRGNADHLQQAFVNLILNAEQVMKNGGKLYVTTSLDGNYVAVSFRDTGHGIPKKYIHKIFEPFYSTREAGKGTGLGLFIIHSIMEDHRGTIEVQSKRGQGANFILKLPVAKK